MANSNLFSSLLDSPSASPSTGNAPRLAPSPITQQPQSNANGNGNGMNGFPMNAGQQMDVNFLFAKVLELSEVLKENREKVQGIVNGASELATRAAVNGASPSLQEANAEVSAGRIADLEHRLATSDKQIQILLSENKENLALVTQWEHEVGKLLERVRNHTFDNKIELANQARHYNTLLQEEKDAHLQSRLEKDEWHANFMRSVAMMRESYRLRCEEEDMPVKVIAGLQNEVRAYRSALGMEPEKPKEEFGYDFIKDIPTGGEES